MCAFREEMIPLRQITDDGAAEYVRETICGVSGDLLRRIL